MKLKKVPVVLAIAAALSVASNAAIVTIEALDIRGTGVFGHDENVSGVTIGSSPATSIDVSMTYSNLDLDGDASANDAVTFTVNFASSNAAQRLWGQGADTGFGSLNDVTVSVTSVSGVTADGGQTIVFDGFTGAAAGLGGNGDFQRNVDINGETVNISTTNSGSFEFIVGAEDFAATSTVLFDNSGGNGGSIVARHYDLQFSSVPEPSVALLGALGVLGLVRRRR